MLHRPSAAMLSVHGLVGARYRRGSGLDACAGIFAGPRDGFSWRATVVPVAGIVSAVAGLETSDSSCSVLGAITASATRRWPVDADMDSFVSIILFGFSDTLPPRSLY